MIRTDRVTNPSSGSIVACLVVGTRVPLLLAGMLALTVIGTIPPPVSEAIWRISPHEIANMFARWDTFFYYSIATDGYRWNPALFTAQNVVFFPLYPWLMRWGGLVIGGHPMIAGLIISLCAFGGALAMLYRLALLEVGQSRAWEAVLLLAVFPYALFFSAVYTESLFLFLTVSAFYAMRRGRLGWVAVCALLAGLTRPNGFWLAAPLACMAWSQYWRAGGRNDAQGSVPFQRALAVSCAPIVGMALFSAYLGIRFADPLAWLHGQAAWGLPLLGRASAADPVTLPSTPAETAIEYVVYAGNIAAFVLAAAAIRPVARRFSLAYAVWILINIVPAVAEHLFTSTGRYSSVLFPVFLWLAVRIPRERLWPVTAAFAAGQALLAVWFFLWMAVY